MYYRSTVWDESQALFYLISLIMIAITVPHFYLDSFAALCYLLGCFRGKHGRYTRVSMGLWDGGYLLVPRLPLPGSPVGPSEHGDCPLSNKERGTNESDKGKGI